MYFFAIYINELLNKLESSGIGCKLKEVQLMCPAYADDIAILAPYADTAQKLLNIVVDYCDKWSLSLNPSKCVCINICGKDEKQLVIGNSVIKTVRVSDHLGVPVCKNLSLDNVTYIENRIGAARRALNTYLAVVAETGGLDPLTLSKIYWTCIIPKLLYGFQNIYIDKKGIQKLSDFHYMSAKRIQRLPINTTREACLAQLGWINIDAFIDKMRLTFMYRLANRNFNLVSSDVFRIRFVQLAQRKHIIKSKSPIAQMIACAQKYGVLEIVNDILIGSVNMSKNEWKSLINVAVMKYQVCQWKCSTLLYSKLALYRHIVTTIEPIIWWRVAQLYPDLRRQCSIIMRLVCNEYKFNMAFATFISEKYCLMCNSDIENVKHLLVECEYIPIVNIRNEMYSEICQISDINMHQMNQTSQLQFILCAGLVDGSQIVNSITIKLAKSICNHVFRMHSFRKSTCS